MYLETYTKPQKYKKNPFNVVSHQLKLLQFLKSCIYFVYTVSNYSLYTIKFCFQNRFKLFIVMFQILLVKILHHIL